MPVLKNDKSNPEQVKKGLKRKVIHLENLMSAVLDFSGGPWTEPEPAHSHPHEQTCYIAEGEILFFCEGETEQHLKAGDMFYVSSGKEHNIQLLTKKARLIDSFSPIRNDLLKK